MQFKLRVSGSKKRRKVLGGESSEVVANVVGDASIAKSPYATLSLYKNQMTIENCLFYSNYNSRLNITISVMIVGDFSAPNGAALKRITASCWLDLMTTLNASEFSSKSLNEFFDQLNLGLSKVGISDGFYNFYSYLYRHDKNTLEIVTSTPESVVRINENKGETLAQSSRAKQLAFNAFEWKVGNSKAVVFASDCDAKILINVATRISGLMYPKKGAAELLHFELKKMGISSNVFWTEISNRD